MQIFFKCTVFFACSGRIDICCSIAQLMCIVCCIDSHRDSEDSFLTILSLLGTSMGKEIYVAVTNVCVFKEIDVSKLVCVVVCCASSTVGTDKCFVKILNIMSALLLSILSKFVCSTFRSDSARRFCWLRCGRLISGHTDQFPQLFEDAFKNAPETFIGDLFKQRNDVK
ncbi:hypothetical protein PR048_020204, partial [Dryococelus australis]